MKKYLLPLFFILFSLCLNAQHLNVNFDIEFEINQDSIQESDEFDIEGEITNVSNLNLTGDIYLDYFIGTNIPPNFFNAVTRSDTVDISGTIQPGDDIVFEFEEIDADDPAYNLQVNKQNIIIIWPRLGPGESGDSIKFYIDTLFVLPDSTMLFNQNTEVQLLNVYPNPITENLLNIDLTDLSLQTYHLTIWNNLGQILMKDVSLQGGQINQLSTKGLNNGLLLVELRTQKGILTKRKRVLLQSSQ